MADQANFTVQQGRPIELYKFIQGDQEWLFTDATLPVTYMTQVYMPAPIKRSSIKQSEDAFKQAMTIEMSRDNVLAREYLGFAAEAPTTLTIFQGQYDDLNPGPFMTYWKGRIISGTAAKSTIKLKGESVFTSIQRAGLRARYERTCRHVLYGTGCKAKQQDFANGATVTGLARGIVVTLDQAYPDGYFTAGIIRQDSGAQRFIESHTGDQLTLVRPFNELHVGDPVEVFAGCDHMLTTCRDRFNNLDNYGGFTWIPTKNPFGNGGIT